MIFTSSTLLIERTLVMALLKIEKAGAPILKQICDPVKKIDGKLRSFLDDMAETMYKSDGIGLAAPQVGILRRVVVIDVGEGLIELVNPKIIAFSGEQEGSEGCLSFPGQWGIVKRPNYVKVKAQNRSGEEFTVEGKELLARAFCHEIDHLDGVIFTDNAVRMLTEEEIEELEGE